MNNKGAAFILGLFLSFGLIGSGYLLGQSLVAFKKLDRNVAVKGFAEREVRADLAMWPISFSATGNDLPTIYTRLEESQQKIRRFLKEHGLVSAELSLSAPRIEDRHAYGPQNQRPAERYRAQSVLTARTSDAAAVKKAMSAAGEMVADGVLLNHSYEFQPRFEYTKLNDIKPEMIAEATKNARSAAMQFAKDSGSSVGAIRNARQGFFSITDRDQYTPEIKRVRVVTTVDYYLAD